MKKALRNIKRKKAREKGAILVVALLVGFVMLIMTTPFLFRHSNQYRDAEKSNRELSSLNLAEAGVERALWEENQMFVGPGAMMWVTDAGGNRTTTILSFTAADDTVMGDIDLIFTAPAGTVPDTRILEATGKSPFIASRTVDRTVRVNLEKFFKSIFDFGFFVDDKFYIKTNYWIDSYDSRDGAYGDGDNWKKDQGYFGMNTSYTGPPDDDGPSFTIDQGSSSNVYGMIAAGAETPSHPDYDPNNPGEILEDIINLPNDSTFVGDADRMILQEPFELPSVDIMNLPPRDMFESTIDFSGWFSEDPGIYESLPSGIIEPNQETGESYLIGDFPSGSTVISGKTATLTEADSGVYTSFKVDSTGANGIQTLQIEGDVAIYVTNVDDGGAGIFEMVNSSIEILADSSLTIVLGDTSFLLQQNTDLNKGGEPANLVILGTDQFQTEPHVMALENNGEINAAIYVPKVHVQGSQGNTNLEFFGAMISYSMDFKSNTNLHYDEALGALDWIEGGIPYWKITSWTQPYNPLVIE